MDNMSASIKNFLRPAVHRFNLSELWLYKIGPTTHLFKLYGTYALIILTKNAFYFLKRFLYTKNFHFVSRDEIFERKKSDTIFVFGSGASLNNISKKEWKEISKHNTIGCNYFVHQEWINMDYESFDALEHCGSFLHPGTIIDRRPKLPISRFKAEAKKYGDLVTRNKKFHKTIFFIPFDFLNKSAVMLLSGPYLPKGLRIYPYKMRYNGFMYDGMRAGPPIGITDRLPGGLNGALAIAAAYGWKNIVLVGVDLYDSKYFFLPPDVTRSIHKDPMKQHGAMTSGVIPWMKTWRVALEKKERKLLIYNPKSLLAGTLDVFQWKNIEEEELQNK